MTRSIQRGYPWSPSVAEVRRATYEQRRAEFYAEWDEFKAVLRWAWYRLSLAMRQARRQ